jgi:L-rhamnose isomerase
MQKNKNIERAFALAEEHYAEMGVNVQRALKQLATIPISLQCWQGDDVQGFEPSANALGGGIAVTGNYPGKARTPEELRSDLVLALSVIPGKHRINLHAIYAETNGKPVDRNAIEPKHFDNWIHWARANRIGLDFNPTFFSHPKAADGFTLTHRDKATRKFWIEHGIACRNIGAAIGKALGRTCVTNVWIPDGFKDIPVDRKSPRERLTESLDAIFSKPLNPKHNLDAVESKLFGIGSECYVAGSHEFYLGYAIKNKKMLCLDTGHFHPTESVADKISSVFTSVDRVLLHVSRGVRWDSDHVVILSDELEALMLELVRGDFLGHVHIGMDYFDASINRVAAWVIGARCVLKALLIALLEPTEKLRALEYSGDFTGRLALQEECKTLPHGAVWDYYCTQSGAPTGGHWLAEVKRYERGELSNR